MKINMRLGKRQGLLIGVLCAGLIISATLFAGQKGINSRFVELKISSPVNQREYSSHIQKLVVGSIVKTYLIEYQYPNASFRVVGIDIRTADNEIYCVHLAPPSLFVKRGLLLQEGDNVIVRGAMMNIDQRPALIASMVSHGSQSIELRTDRGVPKWGSVSQVGRSQISKLRN